MVAGVGQVASYVTLSFSSIYGQRPPYSGKCSRMATLSSASALVRVASRVRPAWLMTLPDRIVLDDPDFLGLVVALLFLAHRWSVFVMVYD